MFRDCDFRVMQLCSLLLDPCQLIFYCLDQYELLPWLCHDTTINSDMNSINNINSSSSSNSNLLEPHESTTMSYTSRRPSTISLKGGKSHRKVVEFATKVEYGNADSIGDFAASTAAVDRNSGIHLVHARCSSEYIKGDTEYLVPMMECFLLLIIRLTSELLPSSNSSTCNQTSNSKSSSASQSSSGDVVSALSETEINLSIRKDVLREYIRQELIQKMSVHGHHTLTKLKEKCKFIGYLSENDNKIVVSEMSIVLQEIATTTVQVRQYIFHQMDSNHSCILYSAWPTTIVSIVIKYVNSIINNIFSSFSFLSSFFFIPGEQQ